MRSPANRRTTVKPVTGTLRSVAGREWEARANIGAGLFLSGWLKTRAGGAEQNRNAHANTLNIDQPERFMDAP